MQIRDDDTGQSSAIKISLVEQNVGECFGCTLSSSCQYCFTDTTHTNLQNQYSHDGFIFNFLPLIAHGYRLHSEV